MRALCSGGEGAAASGGVSSSAAAVGGREEVDMRLHVIVHRLDCTSDVGWGRIMGYATAEECVRAYAQLCVAFGPGARVKRSVWFLRKKMVMAYLTPAERVSVFSLVSVAFGRGAAALKRSAKFGPNQLVLADGSIALDRVEAASIRFPALEDVSVRLPGDLSDRNGFTDARRAPILAKLCTFTFVTTLDLRYNDIAVVPDAIGALTNLKYLHLSGNKIATLPASIGQLTGLKSLHLDSNQLAALPESIVALTNLTTLDLNRNPPLIRSAQSAAVQAWLQAHEDSPTCNLWME